MGHTNKELLGIVWAVGKWRHYLASRHFMIQTDHDSLKEPVKSTRCEQTYMEVGAGFAGV